MSSLILVLSWQGETDAATALVSEGKAILAEIETSPALLLVLTNFAWAATFVAAPRSLEQARPINREVVRLARSVGDGRSLGIALTCLGQCDYWARDYVSARRCYQECIPLLRDIGENLMADHSIWGLGKVALKEGRIDEARSCSVESLAFQKRHKSPVGLPYCIESVAHLAVVESRLQRAARLFSAAAHLREMQGAFAQPLVSAENQTYLLTLRETLNREEFDAAWQEGRALTPDDAIAYALEESREAVENSR
jgi:tetratricopeptide (TPR) repeat protein